jgi:hypothetical protein
MELSWNQRTWFRWGTPELRGTSAPVWSDPGGGVPTASSWSPEDTSSSRRSANNDDAES